VYCYQPDQGYRPAAVGAIILQVGLWDYVYDNFVRLQQPPLQLMWVSQAGLTGAAPANMCGSGYLQTYVNVTVYFPACCPTLAFGEFGSGIVRIPC
jgi:hypothetical protein